ncbi:MAG: lysophospholipid acyltransferase family protein [Armatimonadota bacterium]
MAKEYRQNKPWYRLIQFITRTLFRIVFGLDVAGLENVPKSGPTIIAPIHCSFIDPPLAGCTCRRFMRFMAKEELLKGLLGALIKSLGTFPIARGQGDTGALRIAKATLEKGGTLLIVPEGTRNDGEYLNPLQPGVLLLADKSEAMIVPVGIAGTDKALPRGAKGIKRTRISIYYGKPFQVKELGLTGKALRAAFNEELSNRLVEATRMAGKEIKKPRESSAPASTDPA